VNDEHPTPLPPSSNPSPGNGGEVKHKRRVRYSGKYPRRFEEKYKEQNPEKYGDTVAKVMASGKTPAGTHRSIMVHEILDVLAPRPGEIAADCTLGFGGHAREILARLLPGGKLIGLDTDPLELPRTETRLREAGFGPETFMAVRSNFAGLPQALAQLQLSGVDLILADLGLSSMQIDNPARGFSTKFEGPLDMRMNPHRGQSAAAFLEKISKEALEKLLVENADEPRAKVLAPLLAGQKFQTTKELSQAIARAPLKIGKDELNLTIRRTFQAIRIAVNEEFTALETFLRHIPTCLNPGGRVAILTFHSGEDRRVKKAFEQGLQAGQYSEIAHDVARPSPEERHNNPRSAPAKLRWARKVSG
jgi:16S rRNA (cytosine1402-N4)-methyltransferase